MTNLRDDVLMIGKTENVQALNIIEFDLVNSVQALVENAKFIDNGKHIYEMNMPEKLLVRSDKKLLDHAISNLISNAVKYSENGTTVTVSLSLTDEAHLKIEIKDQGIGIPEEDIGRVFESFYRSHNTGSIEGTGLGMSIVKRSVDSLGGTIDVQSKLGEGTKISMIIPKVVVE
jgi:signal transduction histidine kinase